MARRVRVEVEGGLYHLITRGNDWPYDAARPRAETDMTLAYAKELVARSYY